MKPSTIAARASLWCCQCVTGPLSIGATGSPTGGASPVADSPVSLAALDSPDGSIDGSAEGSALAEDGASVPAGALSVADPASPSSEPHAAIVAAASTIAITAPTDLRCIIFPRSWLCSRLQNSVL